MISSLSTILSSEFGIDIDKLMYGTKSELIVNHDIDNQFESSKPYSLAFNIGGYLIDLGNDDNLHQKVNKSQLHEFLENADLHRIIKVSISDFKTM